MPDSGSKSDLTGQKCSPSRLAGVARLAGKQFGVISLEQLFALGFSYRQVGWLVQQGILHKLHPGVYAFGHTRLVPHARLWAALLTCGPASFLSHRTAAAVWGLRELTTRQIHATVPDTRLRPRRGLVIHKTTAPGPADLAVRNGLRVSSVPRMLIEVSATETRSELDRLITAAVRKRLLDLPQTEAALLRHARRPGVANCKRALRDYRPRRDRRSDLERAFDKLIAGTDIPPPQRNVIVDGWELDCYWPHARLAVELDGRPYHTAVKDTERDKLKDAKLLRKRISTMRITDLRFTLDPQGILADLRSLTT